MFTGLIVALITPFKIDKSVDYSALERMIQRQMDAGIDGILVCGTTGEGWSLDSDEMFSILKVAIEMGGKKVPIIFNSGTCSTQKSVGFTERAMALGADACLTIVPYYNKPTERGCVSHFEELSKVGIPLILYHHPGRTGIKLSVPCLKEILSLPNFVAIKESSGDIELTRALSPHTTVLSGNDEEAFIAMRSGAKGSISVVANAIPREWKLALLNNEQAYNELVESMCLETNPQCIKYLMHLMGYCEPVYRLPLLPPNNENRQLLLKLAHQMLELPHQLPS